MREHTYHVDGNTVRKREAVQERRVRALDRSKASVEARRRQLRRRNRAYFVVITAAVAMMAVMLTWFISVQSAITASVKNIAALESRLNTMRRMNDEAYARASGSVDLEEIKRIAIEELGMQYASAGQIVTYTDGGGNDYVHQMAEIPPAGK